MNPDIEPTADRSPSLWGSIPHLAIGILVGGFALWLAFRRVEWPVLRQVITQVDPFWMLVALGSVLTTLLMVTLRWRLLFFPDHLHLRWFTLFKGIVVGQMLNIVLPARLGEVARAYSVGNEGGMSKARILVTIGVEKMVDLNMFALAAALLLLGMSPPSWLQHSRSAIFITGALALVITIVLSVWGKLLTVWLGKISLCWQGKIGQSIARFSRSAVEGFSALQHWWVHFFLWGLSLMVFSLSAATNYFLFKAFHLNLSPLAAIFLLLVVQVGNAPPSLPGKLGIFNYLIVLGLSFYGIEPNIALSYSFGLYGVAILPKIVLGGFFWGKMRWLPAKIPVKKTYPEIS